MSWIGQPTHANGFQPPLILTLPISINPSNKTVYQMIIKNTSEIDAIVDKNALCSSFLSTE